jgi:hypothetical protein
MMDWAIRPSRLVACGIVFGFGAVAGAAAASAQAVLAEVRDVKPRQIRVEAFQLSSPQNVRIEAIGEEGDLGDRSYTVLRTIWKGQPDRRSRPWVGNAWILDLRSRRVVWELSAAKTGGLGGAREFKGSVQLPAGSYAAYLSAFPSGSVSEDDGPGARITRWLGADHINQYMLKVSGSGQPLSAADVERLRQQAAANAIVAFRGTASERYQQAGFTLDRPTDVEVYAIGEAREDGEFDAGWIINADTRAKVWKLTWKDSEPAGGAEKNRATWFTRKLPAGRYAAFYATDDSHDLSEWNAPPPHDPEFWGLSVRVPDAAARAAVKTFAYEHVPPGAAFVTLTKLGDREGRKQGFTLNRAMDVRIYALGEGRDGRMFDYGWITRADTRERVWAMEYDRTEHAGGDAKNRLVDTTMRLDRGSYIVHYISDDSHSYGDDWNTSAPLDGSRWGITLLSASGTLDRSALSAYEAKANPAILAEITGVRDDDRVEKRFRLDRETELRVYAIGEGSSGGMDDYGWIENAKTGKTVWEMTYRSTNHAGGASKNRRFDGTITLPAGEYVVKFETDGSHAFADWNAEPPQDPDAWGITLFRKESVQR